jgi:hypothetical protein
MANNPILDNSSKYQPKKKIIRNEPTNFSQQEVDLAKTPLFFPEGYEKFFMTLYFIMLPYIAGLMFQFFYIADSRVELYLSLSKNSSFILVWAIGYEILATLILLYTFKMAISFSVKNNKEQQFRRP